ncbi:MAG: PRC-barrel domain-containing protein [Phycisphaeraceae bacterium]
MPDATVARLGSIIQRYVHNARNEPLGRVEDLVVNLEQGFIAYAVLVLGDPAGRHAKRFIIPWSAFRIDPADQGLLLDVEPEALASAPGASEPVPAGDLRNPPRCALAPGPPRREQW